MPIQKDNPHPKTTSQSTSEITGKRIEQLLSYTTSISKYKETNQQLYFDTHLNQPKPPQGAPIPPLDIDTMVRT